MDNIRLKDIAYDCLDYIFSDNCDLSATVEALHLSDEELCELGFAYAVDLIHDQV